MKVNEAYYFKPGYLKQEDYRGRFLYYPCAGVDFEIPILTFRDFVSIFWFVDNHYYLEQQMISGIKEPIKIDGFNHIASEFHGQASASIEKRIAADGFEYKYLEPGYRTDFYEYQGRTIVIHRRRGYDYNSLFGPSTMQIEKEKLGIFFYRGDSYEGGSSHPWMRIKKARMCHGQRRVSLLGSVIDALPNKGIIATDGSNHSFQGQSYSACDEAYYELFKNHNDRKIDCVEAMENAKDFTDPLGRQFSCIGHAGQKYGPTLIWLVEKTNES